MKYLSLLIGFAAAAGAAVYLVVYLYRWEWQRALLSGTLLLAIEGVLVCTVLLLRLDRLERHVRELKESSRAGAPAPAPAPDPYADVRRHLNGSNGTGSSTGPFAWLDVKDGGKGERTYVFVPVLVVAGAALSGAAWLIQKIAQTTARGADHRLAGRLVGLTAPPLPADAQTVRLEDRPAVASRSPWRLVGGVLAVALVIMLLSAGYDRLADATQTREEARPARTAATTVVFRVDVRRARPGGTAARLAAQGLWERCRSSTSAHLEHAPLSRLERDVYVGVVRPGLSPHNLMRLRGCLTDVHQDRATARVLGEGQASR
ncbi:hypothetical protein [Streptomyces sp. NPDC048172]|uniref:hypothetical protein n=1 Tax=Streptomyces sp. NPDC048172 TaxID=3365505 RepID=UPI003724135D